MLFTPDPKIAYCSAKTEYDHTRVRFHIYNMLFTPDPKIAYCSAKTEYDHTRVRFLYKNAFREYSSRKASLILHFSLRQFAFRKLLA